MMYSEILNPYLNNRNQVKNQKGQWVDEKQPSETIHTRTISNKDLSDDHFVVFDESEKEIIIDSLFFGTNNKSGIYMRLFSNPEDDDQSYASNMFVGIKGSGAWSLTQLYIKENGHPLLENYLYDEENNNYNTINKRPIHLPKGGKLLVRGGNYYSENDSFRMHIVYRLRELL